MLYYIKYLWGVTLQELELLENVKKRLTHYLDFFMEESAESGKAGPLLRERLNNIPFNEDSLSVLEDYATPTLQQEFKRAKQDSGSINSQKIAIALTHATCDPLRKSLFVMGLIMGKNPDEKKIAGFGGEEKELTVSACFNLLHSLRDITENLALLVPEKSTPPDELDRTLKEFKERIIPDLEIAVPAIAKRMGYDDAAIAALESTLRKNAQAGREHLHPVPAELWRNAIKPI